MFGPFDLMRMAIEIVTTGGLAQFVIANVYQCEMAK